MASAILKINTVQGFVSSATMHETVRRNMSLPRETVPPQLPQIPLELWQALWDDLANEFADYSIWAKGALGCAPETNTCMGYAKCIISCPVAWCCCVPCCMFNKITRMNTRALTLYDGMLGKYRPRFAAVGVGMSVNEITVHTKNGSSQQKAGFRLDGAAGAAAMGAPPAVAGMTRYGPGWVAQGGQMQMQQGVQMQMQGMPAATTIAVPMAVAQPCAMQMQTVAVAQMKPQPQDEWRCEVCTASNDPSLQATECAKCLNPRPTMPTVTPVMASTNGGGGAAGGTDIATQLVQLSQLRASGALSQGEFDTAKARILAA